jgi:hypothetical protein
MAEGFGIFLREFAGARSRVTKNRDIYAYRIGGVGLCKAAAAILYRDSTIYLNRKRAIADAIMADTSAQRLPLHAGLRDILSGTLPPALRGDTGNGDL